MQYFSINSDLQLEISSDQILLGRAVPALIQDQHNLLAGPPQSLTVDGQITTANYAHESGSRLKVSLQMEEIQAGKAVSLLYTLHNDGEDALTFQQVSIPSITLNRQVFGQDAWTMQGAAMQWGQDFAFPLMAHDRENYLGHLHDGEGGGIPLVYFWNKSIGLTFMQIEPQPQDCSMPVHCTSDTLTASLDQRGAFTLQPGDTFTGPHTVIAICTGDFFEPMALYRQILADQGIRSPDPIPADYEAAWCSWGYEFDVKPAEMIGVLPALQALDIHWLILDDRWFDAYGDWNPRVDTFPGAGAEMRAMNDHIHQAGASSLLWWYPLCVEDGHGSWDSHMYATADCFQQHPDWVILGPDGQVARNNRQLAMLCPALPEVQNHVRALTLKFIRDWGFDGHKLDNIYTIPACHNPLHHHQRPAESTEAMAEAYRIIFETTRALRPVSVIQICPCGTPLSMQLIPWTDQPVTADPTSSAQIRQRIKFYKALCGPRTAVSADHVELSDGCMDFASEVGTGGVPATKFVWPEDNLLKTRLTEYWNLSPEKQKIWEKWLKIYNQQRLSEGETLNLYDLAFDVPETHAIRKGDVLYYSFFKDHFQGEVQLRGLADRPYRIWDYVNQIELGKVDGQMPGLAIHFDGSLLVTAIPDESMHESSVVQPDFEHKGEKDD